MAGELRHRDVVVLARLAGVAVVIWNLPRLAEIAGVVRTVRRNQALTASGMMSPAEATPGWAVLASLMWPLVAGVLLYAGAGLIGRLVMRGLPGPGGCAACGYDLRGIPGGKCPECGGAPGVQ